MNPAPPNDSERSILIVEDERIVAEDLREELEELGYRVVGIAADGETAFALAGEHRPDLVCMDVVIRGEEDGVEVAARIQEAYDIPSIFTTAYSDRDLVDRAKLTNPAGYLVKPYEMGTLRCTLEVAFTKIAAERKLALHQEYLEREVERRTEQATMLYKQLLQASKMEALGNLTGGVAHDFNNMLLPISGYAEFLMESLDDQPDLCHQAKEIHRAAKTASTLTRQLLAFSRRQTLEKQICDLHDVVEDCRSLLRRLIGEDYTFHLDLHEHGLFALVDPGQIEQVLMNLCINARDSMKGGGIITITTEKLEPGDSRLASMEADLDQAWIQMSISDSGCGMDEETASRIFEPFFTTKGLAGTGLGLSVVHGIVTQHDGEIEVDSAPGQGTSFRIFLPLQNVTPMAAAKPGNLTTSDYLGGEERILVIEDEPQVRLFVTRALKNKGYTVEAAYDVDSARHLLNEARRHPQKRFDLILSDCVLPDGNGADLVSEELPNHPQTKAILTSGYTDREVLVSDAIRREIIFLQKPYPLPRLFETVRRALDEDLEMAS